MFRDVSGSSPWRGDGGGKRVASVIGRGRGEVDLVKNETRGKILAVTSSEGR